MRSPGGGIQSAIFPQMLRVALGLSYSRPLPILLLLAGCSSAPTIPDPPREVRVPVPVPCLKHEDIPQRPSMLTDAQLNALDDKRAVIALGQDRRVRQAYQTILEATIAGCR